jgi:HupE / UreJ protein
MKCSAPWAALLCVTAWIAPAPLGAHVVSMSTGELTVDGPTAVFELRIPMYEVSQLSHPEAELLDHIRFGDGHRTHSNCHAEDATYVCRAEYEFPRLHPDALNVECTLFQVTVPNHVHMLTAMQGSNIDQVVFDQTFTRGEVRFHPPSRAEVVARESAAGVRKAMTGMGLLFLIALALAARSGREALALAVVFLAGEWAARPIGSSLPLAFTAHFFEAALALTVAYLAIEILFLPEGRLRWAVVGVLGLFHGLSFAGFPPLYLGGASIAQSALIAPLALGSLKMPERWRSPTAAVLLAAALARFAFLLWR